MKKTLIFIFFLLISKAYSKEKIAYIDINKILNKSNIGINLNKDLNELKKNFEKDFSALRKAAKNNDWQTVSRKAHKAASPSRHIGLSKLSDLLKSIENETEGGIGNHQITEQIELAGKIYKKNKRQLINEANKAKNKS